MRKTYLTTGRVCRVTFEVHPPDTVHTIAVCGEFNGWDPTAHLLQRRKDGRFSLTLSLTVGQPYRFRYLVDGTHWENDPMADTHVPNPFGSEDSVLHL